MDTIEQLSVKVEALGRMVEELRQMQLSAQPPQLPADEGRTILYEDEPLRFVGVAQVTAHASGKLGWKEKVLASSGLADYSMGRIASTSSTDQCLTPLADGMGLMVAYKTDADVRYAWLPNPVIRVYLTQNGGSNGSKTTDCSYTYDAFADAAKTIKIGSTLAPQWRYLKKCPVTAGTLGLGGWTGTGNTAAFVLEMAYETLGSNSCS